MATLHDLMQLRGRRVAVTGACGALGQVICETLAELGAGIVLIDRPAAAGDALLTRLREGGAGDVTFMPCDLEQAAERRAVCEALSGGGLPLHGLINNAAFVGTSNLGGWGVPFADQSVETWRRALEVNLTAAFDLCQQLAPALRRSPGSSIINIGSIYGVAGPDWRLYAGTAMGNPAAYAASKGGLLQLTRWLATTLAPHVRVNAISPGGIARGQADAFVALYEARTPLGRMATEEDFKGAVAYLATDLSRYVTGQNLMVDGGWTAW